MKEIKLPIKSQTKDEIKGKNRENEGFIIKKNTMYKKCVTIVRCVNAMKTQCCYVSKETQYNVTLKCGQICAR